MKQLGVTSTDHGGGKRWAVVAIALAGCTSGAVSNKLIAFREMRYGRGADLEGNYDCI
jgi:hypothetical protein